MASKLLPDYMFDKFDDITPEFLCSLGIKAILIDIDNTLAPYETEVADERIISWFNSLASAGIKATLISNNDAGRVEKFNAPLSLPAVPDAKKPLSKNLLLAMQNMGSDKTNTAVIGDQILTDVYAGKRLGMRAILVPPIKDKKTLFFRAKRLIEKPFIRKFKRIEARKAKGGE